MIINTRNFFLYLLSVAILILAIAATAVSDRNDEEILPVDFTVPIAAEIQNGASVIQALLPDRQEALATMRDKVAAVAGLPAPQSPVDEVAVISQGDSAESNETRRETEYRCDAYSPYAGVWQTEGLIFEVAEGARLLSRIRPTGDTETVLQLPLRTFPSATESCLTNDVVAVALDGSLVRNNEASLYSVFGAETVIGYTLDGFPLHGVATRETDACGGAMVNGQYHYYLSPSRETVLNCFASTPVPL